MQDRRKTQIIRLIAVLQLLARSAEEQVNWLKTTEGFWLPVDEIAHEFNERYILFNAARDDCRFPDELKVGLDRIDAGLQQMSGEQNADLWSYEALADRQEWTEIRRLARKCLEHFPQTEQ